MRPDRVTRRLALMMRGPISIFHSPRPLSASVYLAAACIIIGRNMHESSPAFIRAADAHSGAHRPGAARMCSRGSGACILTLNPSSLPHRDFKGLTVPQKNAIWVSTKRVPKARERNFVVATLIPEHYLFLMALCLLAAFYSVNKKNECFVAAECLATATGWKRNWTLTHSLYSEWRVAKEIVSFLRFSFRLTFIICESILLISEKWEQFKSQYEY